MNSTSSNTMTNIVMIAAFVVLIVFVILVVYKYMDVELNRRYRELRKEHKKHKKNLEKPCPKGCERGICNYKGTCYDPFYPNPKCCAFDKQCRYCKDPSGVIIDKEVDSSEDYIRDNYYKNYQDVSDLNTSIKQENQYINELNDQIRKNNKSIFG